MKKCFDLFFAITGLILLSPLMLLVWFFIILTSGLPGFFCQKRIGLDGRPFKLYKFRTMKNRRGAELGSFDAGLTDRITWIGKILRKTKIDELPQIFNVLRGDMSFVGPRPEVQKWVSIYPERWEKILTVRPGITDNASIEFRNEEKILAESENPEKTYSDIILPLKLTLYESYVDNNSIAGDLYIIWKTFIALFQEKNPVRVRFPYGII